ncbi:MAG: 4-diphosphocytidyl-2-C-methyl-D-erythritol kinase [Acidimicrobiaceae bacterium]|jgi:4-diphosphocytidyl-2-C-methyl-D-erythritol kinase|nr:4-diphosphocytidyl-2-C-methyl-D-erythritol kinase [Acidimicrobiaceae bacterium]
MRVAEPVDPAEPVALSAPAKLTLSLRVTGVRPDDYHEIDAEMVALDLHDTLMMGPGTGLTVEAELPIGAGLGPVPSGPDNLVTKALAAVGRESRVRLIKRIPPGAGLGGGSSDAAAVFRWAGCTDLDQAARLGADVPFCIVGGRATVRGIGESVAPLPYEERCFVLLLPPFGVNTAAVYRAWDELGRTERAGDGRAGTNDLEAPAVIVEPRLAAWRDRFAEVSGARPLLAGSGSTWFLEGTPEELGTEGQAFLNVGAAKGALVAVRTVRADYSPSDDT